jgi:hypothetical protein
MARVEGGDGGDSGAVRCRGVLGLSEMTESKRLFLVPYSSKVVQKNKKIYEELSCHINKLFGGSSQQGIQSGCQFDPFIS